MDVKSQAVDFQKVLETTQVELAKTKAELANNRAELTKTQAELVKTQSQLARTQQSLKNELDISTQRQIDYTSRYKAYEALIKIGEDKQVILHKMIERLENGILPPRGSRHANPPLSPLIPFPPSAPELGGSSSSSSQLGMSDQERPSFNPTAVSFTLLSA